MKPSKPLTGSPASPSAPARPHGTGSAPEGAPAPHPLGTEAEWRVRGACELSINPYQPGRETDFRDDVLVVLRELDALRSALREIEEEASVYDPDTCGGHLREILDVARAALKGERP